MEKEAASEQDQSFSLAEAYKNLESSAEQDPRLARWQELTEHVDQLADRLGHRIDEGIKETVVAFNAHELKTSQSCEGHPDYATGGPYIDIEADKTSELEQQIEKFEPGTPEWEELDQQIRQENELSAQKVDALLNKFYSDRQVDDEARLFADRYGRFTRIESKGIAAREKDPDFIIKNQLLPKYQKEMQDFSEFMKKEYFEGTD